MADDQTQTVDPSDQQAALVQQLLRQTLTGQAAQPQEPPHSGDNRTWGSLLGQALVGGAGPGSTDAANEQAGLRALQQVGLGMMSGSDYSQARHSLGSIVANAIGGAQESNAAQNAAQLDYQTKQQELQLGRVKEAIPLLTMLQTLQQQKALRGVPSSLGATAPGANVNIGAVGLGSGEAPINAAGDSATRKAGEGGPPAPGTPAAMVAQQVHDFWISKGLSEAQVAGILAGGPGSESNFDPTASGDKGTSIGLYQHHAERLDGMRKFFNLSGSQMPTADQQNQYAAWEISPQGPKAAVGVALQNAKTAAEAAAIWTRSFGVPADKTEIGRRAAGAGRFEGIYAKPQPPGAPTVAGAPQTPPAASTAPPAPVVGKGAPIPAGRPTGPPIITDQPAGSATVAGPPGTATVGQPLPPSPEVAGNVNAIIGGMTNAGANVTTLAPGPGTAAPAAPLTTQASTQPLPPPITLPPAVAAPDTGPPTFVYKPNVDLTPAEKQQFDITNRSYENSIRTALTNEDRLKAEATLQQSVAKQAEVLAARRAEDFKQQQADHDKAVEAYHKTQEFNREQAAKQQEVQTKLENDKQLQILQGEEARKTENVKAENVYVGKERERFGIERDGARSSIDNLQMMRALSDNAGTTTPLDNIVVGNMTGRDLMTNLNLGTQAQQEKWGAQQAFIAAKNQMVIELRKGVQMGALSDRDMSFLQAMGPDLMQKPETRASILQLLESAQIRKLRYMDAVEELHDGGMGWGKAKREADKGLGPMLPQVPKEYATWSGKEKQKFFEDHIPSRTIYRNSGGDLAVAP